MRRLPRVHFVRIATIATFAAGLAWLASARASLAAPRPIVAAPPAPPAVRAPTYPALPAPPQAPPAALAPVPPPVPGNPPVTPPFPSARPADPAKVAAMVLQTGAPALVIYEDGKEIGFKDRTVFLPLTTTLLLSESSCGARTGDRVRLVIPVIAHALIPYWKVHPTRAGQPVLGRERAGEPRAVAAKMDYLTRMHDPDFGARLRALQPNQISALAAYRTALARSALGWLECRGACRDDLFPAGRPMVFWDEAFEISNYEATMGLTPNPPSLTQTSKRMTGLALARSTPNRIDIAAPVRATSRFLNFLPPGVAYQLLWSFEAPNLVDREDRLCQLKWDVDFTQIFTLFNSFRREVMDPQRLRLSDYPEYLFAPADRGYPELIDAFEPSNYENEGVLL